MRRRSLEWWRIFCGLQGNHGVMFVCPPGLLPVVVRDVPAAEARRRGRSYGLPTRSRVNQEYSALFQAGIDDATIGECQESNPEKEGDVCEGPDKRHAHNFMPGGI